MEENLEPNNESNNKISENGNKSNSEEAKDTTSEKLIKMNKNNEKSQDNLGPKINLKNENETPSKTINTIKK